MAVWVLEGKSIDPLVGVLVWLWVDWGFVGFLVGWLVQVPPPEVLISRECV